MPGPAARRRKARRSVRRTAPCPPLGAPSPDRARSGGTGPFRPAQKALRAQTPALGWRPSRVPASPPGPRLSGRQPRLSRPAQVPFRRPTAHVQLRQSRRTNRGPGGAAQRSGSQGRPRRRSAASLRNRAVPPSRATWPKPVRVDSSELMEVPRTRLTSLARCTSRRLSWSLSTARVSSATTTLSNKSATKTPTGNRCRDAERRGSFSWARCGRYVVALRSNGVTPLVASRDGLAPEVVRAGDDRSFPLHARLLPDRPTRWPTVSSMEALAGQS